MNSLQNSFKVYIEKQKGSVFFDEPLKNHCTFRIGGPAEILYIPENEEALKKCFSFVKENGVPLHILGNGSNVLIADEGLRGVVVRLMGGLTDMIYLGNGVISCGAGVSLKRLCSFALENSLSGLECLYGIPGSVGGAVYMNAGAYGGEIKDSLMSVRCIDPVSLETEEIPIENMSFSYRSTPFMTNGKIVTAAYFRLSGAPAKEIEDKMSELMGRRKASQPLEYPSAGSTFRRPKEGYAAAHIEQCGLKGFSHGGAAVSSKHAGFVINTGNAAFSDVLELMDIIRETVKREHGVELVPEVEILK